MGSTKLDRARKYEKEETVKIPAEQRPVFHMSVPVGWMNDPNGFSVYQDEYHLFYQYNPYGTGWDSMHWGHVKTKDFVKWEYLPAALAPDEPYDEAGVFSGGAVEKDGKQVLIYTGVSEIDLPDGKKAVRQNQCVAVGDGIDYVKAEENPVITASQLPEGSSLEDFRDPKVWKEDGMYYAVVGSRAADGSGQIALFSSEDLKDWKFCSILDKCENRYGKMWECPDFFPLDEKQILLTSPQDMMAEGLEFHNGNGVIGLIGSYDREKYQFHREMVQSPDYGLDFYAPQTLGTADGRRIMIAWMKSWDMNLFPEGHRWNGMMTCPRELSVRDGRLCAVPVRELEEHYTDRTEYRGETLRGEMELEGIRGRVMDLSLDLDVSECSGLRILVAKDERFYTEISLDPENEILTFDRTWSGLRRDCVCRRSMKVRIREGKIRLRILLDRYSAEIFANDGENVMTSLILTPQTADRIVFDVKGSVQADIVKHGIR
ncbi:sucrose-6-phosphate hydrolase [Lachnoclostridium sp. An169]|uniref:glycoside hydrolase family 32 protein n=1 Tax=Lachnoclostridium sp. An169 TaxID=1965569 RepID=UPI000B396AD8|nr:glycoside hydrolase family 32 protein [Lachnoclostridium sp. An169]OUP81087.1 sucrose-6-phosphate hydrolase [Lachnoclostridium sp. An169]